jgi:hypothetical protein
MMFANDSIDQFFAKRFAIRGCMTPLKISSSTMG